MAEFLRDRRHATLGVFRAHLHEARRTGELPADADPDALADSELAMTAWPGRKS